MAVAFSQRRGALALLAAFGSLGPLATKAVRVSSVDDGESSGQADYKVHLIIGRHGLSCTNVVEKWIHKWDAGRGWILDPFLAGAGEAGSRQSGEDVTNWLNDHDLRVDAVLSSELLRAQETALLTYPSYFREGGSLYVMPYVREMASGASNRAMPQVDQGPSLMKVVKDNFQMNFEWVTKYPDTEPDWPAFLNLMQREFLPKLASSLKKEPGSDIVIALATHSMFMRDSDIGEACKDIFDPVKEKGKPQNNQIVRLQYDASRGASGEFTLERTSGDKCVEVAHGSSTKTCPTCSVREDICMGDVGEQCIGPIKKYAWAPGWLWQKTAERKIVDVLDDMERISRKKIELSKLLQEVVEGRWIPTYQAWGDIEIIEDEAPTVEEIQSQISRTNQNFEQKRSELQQRLAASCWAGGVPQVEKYLVAAGKELSSMARGLLDHASKT